MIRYFIKPLFYNSNKYRAPSGEPATAGYPKKNGFGHEEWNNNPNNHIEEAGAKYRVFHLTSLNPSLSSDDRVIVFPIYSYQGEQRLLGALGNASNIDDEQADFVIRKLGFKSRWTDAWKQARVKAIFRTEAKFKARWQRDLAGLTNWKCPDDDFIWLDHAVKVSASKVTGKKRFIGMFSSHQELDAPQVDKLLAHVGNKKIEELVERIRKEDGDQERKREREDVEEIRKNEQLTKATRLALIEARLGQGRFRANLMKRWKYRCCVTGCTLSAALRASHIKPWSKSSLDEKLDSENGLLLTANLDALFDRGLISFRPNGRMMISSQMTTDDRQKLGLKGLRIDEALTQKQRRYLSIHREANKDKELE